MTRQAPTPETEPGVRLIGGDAVDDDLMWLRDPGRGERLRSYLAEERAFYDVEAERLRDRTEALRARAESLRDAEEWSPAWRVGGWECRWHWADGAEYPALIGRRSPEGPDQTLLDVGSLDVGGFVRLGECAVSPDGRWLAYSVDTEGTERYWLRVRDLASMEDLLERVPDTYYGLAWSRDSSTVLYTTVDHADRPWRVSARDVARWGAEERVVVQEDDESFHLALRASGDGRSLIIRASARLCSEEWIVPRDDTASAPISPLGRNEGTTYTLEPLLVRGRERLAVIIDAGHDAQRLIIGDVSDPRADAVELLAADPGRRLRDLTSVDGRVVVAGRSGADAAIWLIDPLGEGEAASVGPEEPGGHLSIEPYDGLDQRSLCVRTESRRSPRRWWSLDVASGTRVLLTEEGTGSHHEDDYLLEVRHVVARDGTPIPVTITRRREVPLDGTAPCLLYGYGAWETVIDPAFDPVLIALLDDGVVHAHAHVRGGGELGRGWWWQGRMESKVTTFDDFVDVADAIADTLVDGCRIVARGLSAGGLLMGAAYSRRPDRWRAVLAEAPFVDPVTTMSDPTAPLVVTEFEEWGNPFRPQDRDWMLGWSPYDNCPADAAARPALLVTSAIPDPRVSVWEPARWVARLRLTGSDDERLLFRCDRGPRGHWSPPGRHSGVAYEAELMAWAVDQMEV